VLIKSFGARAATIFINLLSCAAVGCGPGGGEGLTDSQHVSAPIVGGATASDYPESVLVEMSQQGVFNGACSGAVIAPQVVLTAGHCVDLYTGWSVQAPFVLQSASASKGETFDWKSNSAGRTDPALHDVGLVYLDQPIRVPRYPALAESAIADGSDIVNVGRVDDAGVSDSELFVSRPLSVKKATSAGFPFDYVGAEVIRPGDSGGPVEVPGTTPHLLVAVNSGAGRGIELLARTDLLATWISERIAAHGGAGAQPPAASPPPPSSVTCTATEVEPNDDFLTANKLSGSVCGSLGAGDRQDWYTWSIEGPGPYDLRLATAGDARLEMWTIVDGLYAAVESTSPVEFAHTSSGAASYIVAVYTFSDAVQSYALTLTK
jgi:hypothetical protein